MSQSAYGFLNATLRKSVGPIVLAMGILAVSLPASAYGYADTTAAMSVRPGNALAFVSQSGATKRQNAHRQSREGVIYTSVGFVKNNSIHTNLISTLPLGTFKPLGVPFKMTTAASNCGSHGTAPCNFFDAFDRQGNGLAIVTNVDIPSVSHVYTLMNAYSPPAGIQIATIEFVGSAGTTQTFPLIAGEDVRDFFQSTWANTLNNGVAGVNAQNAFTCVDPSSCLGAGGTGRVATGSQGTYVIDQQDYTLSSAFLNQNLVQIILTDTYNGSTPILLGITTES